MKIVQKCILGCALGFFFFLSLIYLDAYGVNWDQFQHLARGQAYLHFFTTGKKDNRDVVPYQGRMSFYEKTFVDYAWAEKKTIGHPPLNDILLALSNRITHKYLGIVSDNGGYHIYTLVLVLLGACIIAFWSYELFGWFPALISIMSYYSFPLLFAEQHFNIKDPAVMVYCLGFLYFFWRGITKKKIKSIFVSSVFLGLSLGTKFNILFTAVTSFVWGIFFLGTLFPSKGPLIKRLYMAYQKHYSLWFTIALISVPVIGITIFYATYPALWSNPLPNMVSVVNYYRDIGGSHCAYYPMTPQWMLFCFDRTTARLFLTTIPMITLALTVIGSIYGWKHMTKFGMAPFLWMLMLFVTVIRVTVPISALYGGALRQIMEIIIPLALLSGVGSYALLKRWNGAVWAGIGIILCFVPVWIRMYTLHPHENLYRNGLGIGAYSGLGMEYINGTVSYGNAYKDGIDWVNAHAEPEARVSLVNGFWSSVPAFFFRPDIHFSPTYWSGWKQDGEYLIELVDNQSQLASLFPYRYATQILRPVYEKRIEGYPIVRVWKNDREHVYEEFQKKAEQKTVSPIALDADTILIPIPSNVLLKTLDMTTDDTSCKQAIGSSYILLSEDGKTYKRMYEELALFATNALESHRDAQYPFSGERAAYIKLYKHGFAPCDLLMVTYTVHYFPL